MLRSTPRCHPSLTPVATRFIPIAMNSFPVRSLVVQGLLCVAGLAGCASTAVPVEFPRAAASADVVCHRVSQNGGARLDTFCGTAGQWADLKASTGFACMTTARSAAHARELLGQVVAPGGVREGETCATSEEWRRLAKRSALRSATEQAAFFRN